MPAAARAQFPGMRLVANPDRHIAGGLNRAVRAAVHRIIVRCDACRVLAPDYVRAAVATLERTGATTACIPPGAAGIPQAVGEALANAARSTLTRRPAGPCGSRPRVR